MDDEPNVLNMFDKQLDLIIGESLLAELNNWRKVKERDQSAV
jgi:hypothetical protein